MVTGTIHQSTKSNNISPQLSHFNSPLPSTFLCEARAQTLVVVVHHDTRRLLPPTGPISVVVQDETISSATVFRAIPRASQHAILCIHRLATILHTMTTPLKSEVWSGEGSSSKRRSETRTAFVCELHTCQRVARSIARTNATFDAVQFWTAFDERSHG